MILPKHIRAITFDVGGTLIEPWPSVGHVYAEIASRHGLELSVQALNSQFSAAWGAIEEFYYTRSDWANLVDKTFQGVTNAPLSEDLFPELYSHFGRAEAWHVFDDVLPTLDALASHGCKLGIISNWDERLRPLLRQLELHDYFEVIVVSSETGFAKPSPVIFELAAEKLALPPDAILHVGDSPAADFEGAQAAGVNGLLLRRSADSTRPGHISSLKDVLHLDNI